MNALGYETVTRPLPGGGYIGVAIFSCRRCPATLEVKMPRSAHAHNPEQLARHARDAGWQAHPFKANRARCPICAKNETLPPAEQVPVPPRPYKPQPFPFDPEPEPQEEPDMPPATQNTKATPLVQALPQSTSHTPVAKAAAPDTKTRIRNLLDKHFDDAEGRFLEGYSDQRIGQELDVPWRIVADLREAAYGPLREDPALTEIKAKVEALGARLDQHLKESSRVAETLRAQIDDLRRQLVEMDRTKLPA